MVCINGRIVTTRLNYYTLHFVTNAEILEIIISEVANFGFAITVLVGIIEKSLFVVLYGNAHPTSLTTRTRLIRPG